MGNGGRLRNERGRVDGPSFAKGISEGPTFEGGKKQLFGPLEIDLGFIWAHLGFVWGILASAIS